MKALIQILNKNKKSTPDENTLKISPSVLCLKPELPEIHLLKIEIQEESNPGQVYEMILKETTPFSQELEITRFKVSTSAQIPLGIDLMDHSLKIEVCAFFAQQNGANCNPMPFFSSQKELLSRMKYLSFPVKRFSASKESRALSGRSGSRESVNTPKRRKKSKTLSLMSSGLGASNREHKSLGVASISTPKMRTGFWEKVEQNRRESGTLGDVFKVQVSAEALSVKTGLKVTLLFRQGRGQVRLERGRQSVRVEIMNWNFFDQFDCCANYLNPLFLIWKIKQASQFEKIMKFLQDKGDSVKSGTNSKTTHPKKCEPTKTENELTLEFPTIYAREYFIFCARERQMKLAAKEEWTIGRGKFNMSLKDIIKGLKEEQQRKEWKMEKAILRETEGILEKEVMGLLDKYVLPELHMLRQTEIQRLNREYQQSIHMLSFKVNLFKQLSKEKKILTARLSQIMKKRSEASSKAKQNRERQHSVQIIRGLLTEKHHLMDRVFFLEERRRKRDTLVSNFRSVEELEMFKTRTLSNTQIMNQSEMELFLDEREKRDFRTPRKETESDSKTDARVDALKEKLAKLKRENSQREEKQVKILNKINVVGAKLDTRVKSSFYKNKEVHSLLAAFRIFQVDLENVRIKLATRNKLLHLKLNQQKKNQVPVVTK